MSDFINYDCCNDFCPHSIDRPKKCEKCPTGPTGPMGAQGLRGETGATGPTGATGLGQEFVGAQYQLVESEQESISVNNPVVFNTLISNNSPVINYNLTNGEFTLNETGLYYVAWSFATNGAGFSSFVSMGIEIVGVTTINNTATFPATNITGTALVDVVTAPQVIRLINTSLDSVTIDVVPVQANISIVHLT